MTPAEIKKLEDSLWQSADTLRANSDLKSTEYSTPVLGLIFLRFADNKYSQFEAEIKQEYEQLKGTRREKPIHEIAVEKCGFYLPDNARYDYLLNLPEKEDIANAIKEAMAAIEEYKPELKGILPQDEYFRLVRRPEYREIPKQLLKNFADIPKDASGDLFGQIYEYFLGNFALAEGQGGGEFFTPRSVVRLMVEIIEPHDGTVFDPACGSGGMFVQSAQFIERRRKEFQKNGEDINLFVYGQEKTFETVKLARMNLAVNGLRGDIRQANTYYEDPFNSFEKYDYVLTNPPFNVDEVNLKQVENDRRFNTYGIPRNKSDDKKKDDGLKTVPNANYLWINLFATSLKKPNGRAALVMANSASDARHSEVDIRKKLINENLIYAILTLPSNMFYTVTLPATLWFFDKGKQDDKILFIDARNVFTQVDRSHREFSGEQIQDLAIIARLERGQREEFVGLVHRYFEQGMEKLKGNKEMLQILSKRLEQYLVEGKEQDIPDLSEQLEHISDLEREYQKYLSTVDLKVIDTANSMQRELDQVFSPFFTQFHEKMKGIEKKIRHIEKELGYGKYLKQTKIEIEQLHQGLKDAEYYFLHIKWLQERFPEAMYEDVTGLCKLASLDEILEQDYSLNPGRYVGVVIEEDGKTEEEFIEEILLINEELNKLNDESRALEGIIHYNIEQIAEGK